MLHLVPAVARRPLIVWMGRHYITPSAAEERPA
jgi:hypothetical protein